MPIIALLLLALAAVPTADGPFIVRFEAAADTAGWTRYGDLELRREDPPGGGHYALWVSGGCFYPHAEFAIRPVDRDRRMVLRAVAKSVHGGFLQLGYREGTREHQVHLTVADPTWRQYESADTLLCPAGRTPLVTVQAGGFVSGGILIERIEVAEVP